MQNKQLNLFDVNKLDQMNSKPNTLKEFANNANIELVVNYADNNPNMANDNWQANHYKLKLKKDGKQFSTFFSQGIGIQGEPKLEGVLECLQVDARSAEYGFSDFCAEFGYDVDSIKAYKTYKACGRIRGKLYNFLGSDFYKFIEAEAN